MLPTSLSNFIASIDGRWCNTGKIHNRAVMALDESWRKIVAPA